MLNVLWAVLILAGLGLILGVAVAIACKVLHVKEDKRLEEVTKMLPGYNCGACGYPGCSGMAEALVEGKEKSPVKCKPSKQDRIDKIVQYLKDHPTKEE